MYYNYVLNGTSWKTDRAGYADNTSCHQHSTKVVNDWVMIKHY